MMKNKLIIATRNSPLAIKQTEIISCQLMQKYAGLNIQLLPLTTTGDKVLDKSLAKLGGKGLFVKELEDALLDGRADIAVHSMKDVTTVPKGLVIPVICKREKANDALISNKYKSLNDLPIGAKVGTSSLRRISQLKILREDLDICFLRGNVNTRLKKLDNGDFDAIILAVAGLMRLDLEKRITYVFELDQILPAPGQGALGVECRDDKEILEKILYLNDPMTQVCVTAERAFSNELGGNCSVPIAAYAHNIGNEFSLRGLVCSLNGKKIVEGKLKFSKEEADLKGSKLAKQVIAQGAKDILIESIGENP